MTRCNPLQIRPRGLAPSARLARRLRHARPGSVLILVVALLVLLALIGTAWMSTARIDRYAAQQNTTNTQVELLLQAAISLAQSAIVDDVFGGARYRPGEGPGNSDYEHHDYARQARDEYIASRLPEQNAGGLAYWPAISGPAVPGGFEAPYAVDPAGTPLAVLPHRFPDRTDIYPDFIDIASPSGGTRRLPALNILDPVSGLRVRVAAADTDGDGIADAALFRMPVGNLSDVTYYVAIRTIDNNSAVNVNTAWQPNPTAAGYQFYPTNIDLRVLLNPVDPNTADTIAARDQPSQVDGVNKIRFTDDQSDDRQAYDPANPTAPGTVAVNFAGTARGDFGFVSPFETAWRQMGSRLMNPGYFNATGVRFDPLPIGEQMTLAYKFILRNPIASRSLLEDSTYRLGHSLFENAKDQPYDPSAVAQWYTEQFDRQFPLPATLAQLPIRPYVVTTNPVSNAAPTRSRDVDNDGDGAGEVFDGTKDYKFGEFVKSPDPAKVYAFMCMLANAGPSTTVPFPTNFVPGTPGAAELIWAPMSWSTHPTKASVNTAGFGELWMAYLAAMDARGAGAADPVAPFPLAAAGPVQTSTAASRREFRNVLRDPDRLTSLRDFTTVNDTQMLPADVMKLRAALAAVNTIDLRDGDRDVTARRIVLNALVDTDQDATTASVQIPVDVAVYGFEPQPVISEIYANNNIEASGGETTGNKAGYVAIELYNPYSFPISLDNWNLGLVDRRRIGPATDPERYAPTPAERWWSQYPYMTMQPLSGFTGFGLSQDLAKPGVAAPTIPAGGTLVLENFAEGGEAALWPIPEVDLPKVATERPAGSGLTVAPANRYFVPGLHEVLREVTNIQFRGGELYLLRPRRGDGVLTEDRRPESPFAYSEINSEAVGADDRQKALADLIPVDSFDFFAFRQFAPSTDTLGDFQVYHYTRVNDPWRSFYPGRWDPTTPWDPAPPTVPIAPFSFRQEGVNTAPGDPVDGDPWLTTPPTPAITLGLVSPTPPKFHHPFGQVQLSNVNMPGWNPLRFTDLTTGVVTTNPAPYTSPFGGFARNGDILQVPFMGSYRIRFLTPGILPTISDANYPNGFIEANPFLELNPITQDMVLVHDADTRYPTPTDADNDPDATIPSDDVDEQLGRFAPIIKSPRTEPDTSTVAVLDFSNSQAQHRYAWARDLFHYLTVQSPQDDYLPDTDPAERDYSAPPPAPAPFTFKYPAATGYYPAAGAPEPVPNKAGGTPATANAGKEDGVGIEGLININTAPAAVLATVPFVPDGQDTLTFDAATGGMALAANQVQDNYDIAQAIVWFRDVNAGMGPPFGAFKSLLDLNAIFDPTDTTVDPLARRGFHNAWGSFSFAADPDDGDGDLSPANNVTPPPVPPTDGVRGDFEERFLMMNRVSNLLTTRSDTFTVYVQVQGWRGVESGNPELVVQRRAAFIADRNLLNQTNRSLTTVNVPTE